MANAMVLKTIIERFVGSIPTASTESNKSVEFTMWIRETRQFKPYGLTGAIAATLNIEEFETKEEAIPEGAVPSKLFGEPIYEKGVLHFEVWENKFPKT